MAIFGSAVMTVCALQRMACWSRRLKLSVRDARRAIVKSGLAVPPLRRLDGPQDQVSGGVGMREHRHVA